MDGKIFDVKDAVQGENAPPLHPNCRSTIVPYIGEEYEPKTRIARDPETGENYYIENMNYKEWRETYLDSYNVYGESRQDLPVKKEDWDKFLDKKVTNEINGVKKGSDMTFKQADSGKVNPNFEWESTQGYNTNCQSCVSVFEARLRGFDIEALPNNKNNPIENMLSGSSYIAWKNKDGTNVSLNDYLFRSSVKPNEASGAKGFWKRLNESIEPNARYSFSFRWNDKNMKSGHIISLLTDKDKNIKFYDPQINQIYSSPKEINALFKEIKWNISVMGKKNNIQPMVLRIDDKEMVYNVFNGISKKAR